MFACRINVPHLERSFMARIAVTDRAINSKLGSTSTYLDRFVKIRLARITGPVEDAAFPNFNTATVPSVSNLTTHECAFGRS